MKIKLIRIQSLILAVLLIFIPVLSALSTEKLAPRLGLKAEDFVEEE